MPESPSYLELLKRRILPNVLWIVILVFTIGVAFLFLQLIGADQLIIGFSLLAMVFFLLMDLSFSFLTKSNSDLYARIAYKGICIGDSVAASGILGQWCCAQRGYHLRDWIFLGVFRSFKKFDIIN
jgi:hypothetical protein